MQCIIVLVVASPKDMNINKTAEASLLQWPCMYIHMMIPYVSNYFCMSNAQWLLGWAKKSL